tara:strand:- start:1677 stop:1919 length:243 start_codon:yes stop_codon:yes gene_type:complete
MTLINRVQKIKEGMKEAKSKGKHIGRPGGQDGFDKFLSKPKSQEILGILKQGLSLRGIQRQTEYSINTVRKVKSYDQQGA